MPSVYPLIELENNEQWRKDLINTIIIKDIAQRYNLRDIDFVYDIYMYLLNNI
jgi:predicted AAA+ superfamily ATPase